MKETIYKSKKYKLTGKCLQCGKCCLGRIEYISKPFSEGGLGLGNYDTVILLNPDFKIDTEFCKHYNIKTKICRFHKVKPFICLNYPRLFPELELFPDCGYKWEYVCDTDEKNTYITNVEKEKEWSGTIDDNDKLEKEEKHERN